MIKKENVIEGLDRFLDRQRFQFLRTIAEEKYESVSFQSGYIEGLEMAKAIILATKEEEGGTECD